MSAAPTQAWRRWLAAATDSRGRPALARGWQLLLALLLAVVLWLALTPAPPPQASLGWDKLNHLSGFITLTLVASFGFAGHWRRIGLALLAYGALIEVLQSFTPSRSAEWADLLADALGITAGLLLAAALAWLRVGDGRKPRKP